MWSERRAPPPISIPGALSPKLHETECLENCDAYLLVVMKDVYITLYHIYLRLRLSDVILQKNYYSISISSTNLL